jgi:hypothetical protein
MTIAVLSIDLLAKTAKFELDMARATQVAKKHATEINNAFSGLRAGMAGLAAGVSLA